MMYVKFVPMFGGTPAQVIVADEDAAYEAVEGLVKAAVPGSDPAWNDATGTVYDGRCYCGCCDGYGKTLGTIFIIPAKQGEIIFG